MLKNIIKKSGLLILGIGLAGSIAHAANDVRVKIDGNVIEFDVEPQITEGRTMVPMRKIFETLGAEVNWDNSSRTATAVKDGVTVSIAIDDYAMYRNGEKISLDVPAKITDGRTLVPVRAISEAFECYVNWDSENRTVLIASESYATYTADDFPDYYGTDTIELNDGFPNFKNSDKVFVSFEHYSELDYLGRCGTAYANLSVDTMPTSERESISSVTPSGWQQGQYSFVSGGYLYNRCHLIGFQLAGENANAKNLITGTRYLNVNLMLPYENMVADYIDETGNHVLYRITPVFEDTDLVAEGVVMEAYSVEDNGAGICYNVYCYNVQPGVKIDYAMGYNYADGTVVDSAQESTQTITVTSDYILNTNTKKFHYSSCGSVSRMSEKNKSSYSGTREELISQGYSPCGNCKP